MAFWSRDLPRSKKTRKLGVTARTRMGVAVLAGLIAGALATTLGITGAAPLVGWDVAGLTFIAWVWLTVARMDAEVTASHAVRENPGKTVADIILTVASIASLVAVGFVIVQAGNAEGAAKAALVALGILSVVISWSVVHTLYALKYARLYYGGKDGGLEFQQKAKPRYVDFAYLAFTIGMTFQVSDTEIQDYTIRKTVLHHALLSYLFGTVIVATTINLVAGLSK